LIDLLHHQKEKKKRRERHSRPSPEKKKEKKRKRQKGEALDPLSAHRTGQARPLAALILKARGPQAPFDWSTGPAGALCLKTRLLAPLHLNSRAQGALQLEKKAPPPRLLQGPAATAR